MLSDENIDTVFVSSTNNQHHRQVLAAAAAGKYILCKRPIAVTVADARAMARGANDAGVVLAVNHQQRELPAIRRLRALIADWTLGTIRAARLQHAGRLRDDLRTWRLYDRDTWPNVQLDLTVHDVGLVRFLLRAEVAQATAITRFEDDAVAATSAMAVPRMSDGPLVTLHENFNTPFAQLSLELHGDDATAGRVRHTAQTPIAELWLTRSLGQLRERVNLAAVTAPYFGVIQAFNLAVRDGGKPSATGEDRCGRCRSHSRSPKRHANSDCPDRPGALAGIGPRCQLHRHAHRQAVVHHAAAAGMALSHHGECLHERVL